MRLCIVGDFSQGTKKARGLSARGLCGPLSDSGRVCRPDGNFGSCCRNLRRVALRMFAAFAASFGGFLGIVCEVAPTLVAALLRIAIFVVAIVHSFIGGGTKTLAKAHRS